jgi:hypothetical protein
MADGSAGHWPGALGVHRENSALVVTYVDYTVVSKVLEVICPRGLAGSACAQPMTLLLP